MNKMKKPSPAYTLRTQSQKPNVKNAPQAKTTVIEEELTALEDSPYLALPVWCLSVLFCS